MPKNHRHVDAEVKKEQIERAAAELFMEQGYESTSMAAIARDAGIATNTIYWYYPSKDDLLLAVLNKLVAEGLQQMAASTDLAPVERVMTLMELFEGAGALMNVVHSRLAHSQPVKEWHEGFHAMMENMIAMELVQLGSNPATAQGDTKVIIYVIEGLLAHPHQAQEREQILGRLYSLLTRQESEEPAAAGPGFGTQLQ